MNEILTDRLVEWSVRKLAAQQIPLRLIARRFQMPLSAVEAIIAGRPWRRKAAAEPRALGDLFDA